MNWFSKAAVGGLLWLAFSAVSFGDTLFDIGNIQNVNEGGQFSAYLNTPLNQLIIYCVDYRNDTGSPDVVNISTPDSLADIANTRYGTTPTAGFSFYTSGPALNALDRYVLAGWLTTQFDFGSGVTLSDEQIQNAIWTLLSTNGTGDFPSGNVAGVGTWITQAETWETGAALAGTLAQFESTIRIYTTVTVAGDNDLTQAAGSRYAIGMQEMIGTEGGGGNTQSLPEPQTIAMMGAGLLALGLIRMRRAKA